MTQRATQRGQISGGRSLLTEWCCFLSPEQKHINWGSPPILRRFCKIAKNDYHIGHVLLPICKEQFGLPLGGFSWNLVSEYFSLICPENSSFVKIWKEKLVVYVDTNVHLCIHLTESFWKWEMLRGCADKSLARPTSRCRRTESIVSFERGVCSCAELQVSSGRTGKICK